MPSGIPLENILFQLFFKNRHQFLFLGDLEVGTFHWSENALVPLQTTSNQTGMEIWDTLLMPSEAERLRQGLSDIASGKRIQFLDEFSLQTSQGRFPVQFQIWSVDDSRIARSCIGIITNYSFQELSYVADGLLGNHEFHHDFSKIQSEQTPCGILILSLDSFKRINEIYSHAFGDKVLQILSKKMMAILPKGTALYRLDGDSFGLLLKNSSPEEMLIQFARFQELTLQPLLIDSNRVSLTFSGASSFYPQDGSDTSTLLRCARLALGVSKTNGGNQFVLYSDDLSKKAQRDLLLLEKLRESIVQGFSGFYLNYQPLILSETGDLYGCEVLLRWKSQFFPEEVAPAEFVPMLERNGLMPKVGAWVMQQALQQCAKWIVIHPSFQMNINATCEQFQNPEFRFYVMDCLSKNKISPEHLTLELTESGQIVDTGTVSQTFDFFRSQGIKIAFDDFGTGYASLDLFRVLSADQLKIDRSFLERLTYDVTDQKIIAHLISLCESMNMNVCVEGIESPEVVNIVRQLRPMLLQGYYYNKPLTAKEFEQFYFLKKDIPSQALHSREHPEVHNTLVYSPLRPAQAMTGQELVDTVHAGIFQVALDPHLTFLTCNEGYRKMLGYTAQEVESRFKNHALAFVHPDDVEAVNREIRRQLGIGNTVNIEFRLLRSDGSSLWILGTGNVVRGKNGTSSLSVVILDNDEAKRRSLEAEQMCRQYQRRLTESDKDMSPGNRYEVASTQWGEVLFECDLQTDTISYSENFSSTFGRPPSATLSDAIDMIHPEDRAILSRTLVLLRQGELSPTIEVRIQMGDGSYLWCALYFNEVSSVEAITRTVIGKMRNIDKERRERDRLLLQAQTDPLTKIYNKSTVEEKIRLAMTADFSMKSGALFMIDLDNFKQINDSKGHPYGDQVLREIARRLGRIFSAEDFLGRVGGDEFMAFVTIPDMDYLEQLCARIVACTKERFVFDGIESTVSISVGVSCYPSDGSHFYDLFCHADSALYRAKYRGKNCYCIFSL